jgi:zinc protease
MKKLIILTLTLFLKTNLVAGMFNSQSVILSNGLQIVVIPNAASPSVSVGVLYKVGTADDPADKVGLSHFLEHMMFKGTKNVPGDQYTQTIKRVGGYYNAMTSFDFTMYEAEVSKDHLEMILVMEADRMVNLQFKPEEVISEKDVVFEERRMRIENHPFGQAHEVLLRALNLYHPYGVLPIGSPQHIAAYDYASTRQHYERWYAPNNAVLIVAGDTNLEEVKTLAEKHFGPLEKKDIPQRQRVQNVPLGGISQHIEQKNPRNANVIVSGYYEARNFARDKEAYYALSLLCHILGGHHTSAFYRHFVEDKKLCLAIAFEYEGDGLDPQPLSFQVTLEPGGNVQALKAELTLWINNLLKNGVDEKEIEKAKKDLLAHLTFLKDGNSGNIRAFISLASGQTIEDIEAYADKVRDLTAEQVNKAAALVLGTPPYVTMDLYPKA